MGLFCVGLSHRVATVSLRERFAVAGDVVGDFLVALRRGEGLSEVVVLSTCNRVEIYGVAKDVVMGMARCVEAMVRMAGVEADFYRLEGREVVRHLIGVGAGMDSMVPGETEIFGQLKTAYEIALAAGTTGRVLNRLFQMSFRASKRVRTATGIGRGAVSMGGVACRKAVEVLGDLSASRTLLIGAGEVGAMVARCLKSRGVGDLLVTNRTMSRAELLSCELGGCVVDFADWKQELRGVDILVACAASPVRLLCVEEFAAVMSERLGRKVLVMDLAVPRNFDPEIRRLKGVEWHDVDSLQKMVREGHGERIRELAKAERLVENFVKELARDVECADEVRAEVLQGGVWIPR